MRAALLLLIAVAACAYDTPWGPHSYGPGRSYDGGSPGRLTINVGADRTPAWLPGDTALLYSVERGGDHDRCLGVLSARTWTLQRTLCHGGLAPDSMVDAFEWPAARNGRVAFQWARGAPGAVTPRTRALMVAAMDRWDHGDTLVAFYPNAAGGAVSIGGVQHVAWVADTSLVCVVEDMAVAFDRATGTWDTSVAPVAIERVDFGSGASLVTVVPGTAGATSLAVNDSATAIYYTVPGNSAVYRRSLDSGAVSIAYAFAPGVVPTDVQVRGTRMAAIVAGGLHLVDLRSSSDSVVTEPGVTFGHPALSRDGHLIVVEGTSGPSAPDLWRVVWP